MTLKGGTGVAIRKLGFCTVGGCGGSNHNECHLISIFASKLSGCTLDLGLSTFVSLSILSSLKFLHLHFTFNLLFLEAIPFCSVGCVLL